MAKTEKEKMRDTHNVPPKALKKQGEELVKMATDLYQLVSWAGVANSSYFDMIEMPIYELAEKIGGDIPSLARSLLFRLSSFLRDHPDPEYPQEFKEIFTEMVRMEKALKAYVANLLLEC